MLEQAPVVEMVPESHWLLLNEKYGINVFATASRGQLFKLEVFFFLKKWAQVWIGQSLTNWKHYLILWNFLMRMLCILCIYRNIFIRIKFQALWLWRKIITVWRHKSWMKHTLLGSVLRGSSVLSYRSLNNCTIPGDGTFLQVVCGDLLRLGVVSCGLSIVSLFFNLLHG